MARPIPTEAVLDNCAKCTKETRHEPDREGVYHCTGCRTRESQVANKKIGKVLMFVFGGLLTVGLASAIVARCTREPEWDEASYGNEVRACARRGVEHFKEISSYPRLSTGEDAEEEALERCRRTLTAFPE